MHLRLASLAIALALPIPAAAQAGTAGASPVARSFAPSFDRPGERPRRVLQDGRTIVEGELLLQVGRGQTLPPEAAALGARLIGAVPRLGILRIELPPDEDPLARRADYAALASVEHAALHDVGSIASAPPPDDTHFASQWHLDNQGQSGGEVGADVDALAAWDIRTGDGSIHVAVLDSGVDLLHPELAGRLLPGHDFVEEDNDPSEVFVHGTHVIGLLAANSNDAFGSAGVDPGCSVLPIRVLGNTGSGTTFDLIQGLDFAASSGARIAVMSLQGFFATPILETALADADAAGVILFAASGNGSLSYADFSYPSASPSTISIGMTGDDDERAPASGTGLALDFVAPGENVLTIAQDRTDTTDVFWGTSAATPIAAGIASLLLSQNPTLDRQAVYELLRAGAEDLVGAPAEDTPGWDKFHGHGRLNAFASLAALCGCTSGAPLTASPGAVSPVDGGSAVFQLDAGVAHAGEVHWLLGSASGTVPGLPLGAVVLPLAYDPYFVVTVKKASSALLPGSLGVLDATGRSSASLVVPALGDPSLEGLALDHAFVVFDAQLVAVFASNSVPLTLTSPVTQTVFSEDFESGAAGWTFANGFTGLWHLAAPGECGAPTTMAAYTHGPVSCSYVGTFQNKGTLVSPTFTLLGEPPYTLELSMIRAIDAVGTDATTIRVVHQDGVLATVAVDPSLLSTANAGSFETLVVPLELSSKWSGRSVRLELELSADFMGNGLLGWMVDDLVVESRVQ